jgi:hypothetical protein
MSIGGFVFLVFCLGVIGKVFLVIYKGLKNNPHGKDK